MRNGGNLKLFVKKRPKRENPAAPKRAKGTAGIGHRKRKGETMPTHKMKEENIN